MKPKIARKEDKEHKRKKITMHELGMGFFGRAYIPFIIYGETITGGRSIQRKLMHKTNIDVSGTIKNEISERRVIWEVVELPRQPLLTSSQSKRAQSKERVRHRQREKETESYDLNKGHTREEVVLREETYLHTKAQHLSQAPRQEGEGPKT